MPVRLQSLVEATNRACWEMAVPIASMTGFARVSGNFRDVSWAWELKSVNGRGLDMRLRVAPGLDGVEIQVREILQRQVQRGTIQANLAIDRPPRPAEIRINHDILAALVKAAGTVHDEAGSRIAPASVDGLLAVRGVVEIIERPDDDEARAGLTAAVIDGFSAAVGALVEARSVEGRNVEEILSQQIASIEKLVGEAEVIVAGLPQELKARISEQVQALLSGSPAFDPERLHQEAILLATRADVREELDRLQAHIDHARKLVADGGAIGRKLDFLAQEFNREANTLCSKSSNKQLTQIGLSLKTVIDQMREQVQNIE